MIILTEFYVLVGLLWSFTFWCFLRGKLNGLVATYFLATSISSLFLAKQITFFAQPLYQNNLVSSLIVSLLFVPPMLLPFFIPVLFPCGVLVLTFGQIAEMWKSKSLSNPSVLLKKLANEEGHEPILMLSSLGLFFWVVVAFAKGISWLEHNPLGVLR